MPTSLDELIYQTAKFGPRGIPLITWRDAISAEHRRPAEGPLPSWRTVYDDLNDLLKRG